MWLPVTYTLFPYTTLFRSAGDLSTSTWTVSDDQHGGANIADPPAATVDALGPVVMQDPGLAPAGDALGPVVMQDRSVEHTSEPQALMQNQTSHGSGVGDAL